MDEEDVEELDLTEDKNDDDFSNRSAIMRQLLNELFLINEYETEYYQHHPFSTLEVIVEEATPSAYEQQLEDNISAIQAGIHSRNEYPDSESDTYTTSEDCNSNKNMYSINQRQRQGSYSDQSTVSGITTRRTFNDSNTSNIDVQNSEQCKEKKTETTNQDDETSLDSVSDKQKLYQKYEQFINDDTRYIQRDTPKRSQFLTLNKKYERGQAKQRKQKQKDVKQTKINQKPKQINRNNSFHCLNTYSIKSPHLSTLDYEKCTVEELQDRVQYFEQQIIDLQNEFKLEKQRKTESSEEDPVPITPKRTHRLDRGDYETNTHCKNLQEESPTSIKSVSFSNRSNNESVISPRRQDNSTIIVVGNDKVQHINKPSSDAIKILSPRNNTKNLPTNKGEFPKIMCASTAKHVSTQVNDTDWQKICYVKKEMSECGSLRISLPNSIDSESDDLRTRRRVDFDSASTIVHYTSMTGRDSANRNESINFINVSPRRHRKSNKFLGCLCCFRKMFKN